jgi:flavodoxin
MKALIVYDSYYGNTENVAKAIAARLAEGHTVTTVHASKASLEDLAGVELLVVGSPTRAFRPTTGTLAFVRRIPANGLLNMAVAVFDTRMAVADTNSRLLAFLVKIFGYAAEPLAKRLKAKGGIIAVEPQGFLVKDSEGPLAEGELERAATWIAGALT